MSTITSANSSLAIAVANLYTSPQTISGFAADDMFTADALDMAEVVMGADGTLSSGFVFNPVPMTITIMPTSPSLPIFENWASAQRTAREVYVASATIVMPGIRRKYTLKNGTLRTARVFPDNRKTLQPIPFVIVWESVIGEAY